MSTPDVRVRLSAEGVAEVVAALKKIEAEGGKAARKGKNSFFEFNSVLGSTNRLLGALGLAFGVQQLAGFLRDASRATDELGKLSLKVGASIENLSALQFAAATAGVSNDQLAKGLIQLNKRIGEFGDGLEEPRRAFADLGLTIDAFNGLDAAERLEVVAKRLGGLEAGAQKTKLAMKLFEEAGAQLIPLLDDVANRGLAGVREEARKLGVLFDTKTVAAITKMNDDLAILGLQAQVLAAQFLSGLAPAISQSAEIISGGLAGSGESMRRFGEAIGVVLKLMTALTIPFDEFATSIGTLAARVVGYARGMSLALQGEFERARLAIEIVNRSADRQQELLRKRTEARLKAFAEPPPDLPDLPTPTETIDPSEVARRRAEAARVGLDAELAIVRAQARRRSQEEQQAFEQGLRSVLVYYTARQRIIDEQADLEVATLLKKKALLSAETDEIRAQTEARKIDARVEEVRENQRTELAALQFQATRATRELAAKSLNFEREILELQGRRHDSALLAIEEEIEKADLLYRQQGFNEEQRLRGIERLRQALSSAANFDEAQRVADFGLAELGRARARIDAQVQAGLLTQLQAQRALQDIENRRLESLRLFARELLVAAEATGNPEKIAQAQEFADSIEAIAMASANAGATLVAFQDAAEQAGLQALTDFFDEGITQAENLGDAVRNMAATVIDALRRVAAQALATRIFEGVASLFSPVPAKARGGVIRRSQGGLLRGPGTGTSDSILAFTDSGKGVRLSNMEFVVRASRVMEPGALKFLETFNAYGMKTVRSPESFQGFAEGGQIGSDQLLRPGGPAHAVKDGRLEKLDITLRLDDGIIFEKLASHRGEGITLRHVARNRNGLGRVL